MVSKPEHSSVPFETAAGETIHLHRLLVPRSAGSGAALEPNGARSLGLSFGAGSAAFWLEITVI